MQFAMRLHTILPALVLLTSVMAQPYQYGCHHWRNLGNHKHTPSAQEKNQIDETIARSDTFDILHYDINLDVTDYSGEQIKAVTTIAKSLDIWTVAEGVEEPVQVQWLKDYDCSCGQGYLFSRPATPDELENLVMKMNSSGISSASA